MEDRVVIEQALARIKSELGSELLGVVVGGSRLRSEADLNSDIDVVVVVDRSGRRRWNFVIDGVEVETLINPPFQMRRYFKEEAEDGRGVMPHLLGTGRILFDPQGLMATLQAEARAVWDAGPPPLSDRERWQFRYYAADAMRDLADVEAADPERTTFLLGIILRAIIDQHYRISGRWLAKPKRLLDHLNDWDAHAARLARRACNDAVGLRDRCDALRALADHVLAPLGGIMPLEWQTEWEALEPPQPDEPSAA
jgi:predicted nucleotidyltransferase